MDTSNEIKQDIKILTYFKMKNNMNTESEYILYNYESSATTIYIASVFHDGEVLKLIKPTPESLPELKRIIQNLVSVNPNSFIFSQNKYQYIDVKNLKDKQIEQEGSQKIKLSDEQYNNMINSKYLMYPYSNMLNAKEPSKYNALSDTISIVVSAVLLIIILGGLIAYHFNWGMLKAGVFDIDGIIENMLIFNLYIHNYLIIQLAIAAFIFSLTTYKVEKSHPLLVWFVFTIFFIIIFTIWYKTKGIIDFNNGFIDFLKGMSIYSICTAIIFTIPYVLCKEVATLITNKFSFCNFISYYTIYFFLFAFSYIGIGLFYHNYLVEHVTKFVAKIM